MTSDTNPLEKRIKRQIHGKIHNFLAVVPLGFEESFIQEMKFYGIEQASFEIKGDGKIAFASKLADAWKVVAYSRIANRLLMEVGAFNATNFGQLEKKLAEIPWELYLFNLKFKIQNSKLNGAGNLNGAGKNNPLDIHVSCKHSRLYHSDAIAERALPIIQKQLQEFGIKEGVEDKGTAGTQNLYIDFVDDRCTLWLDLAGEELYKRGHERFVAEAPLKETIAAAMIFEANQNIKSATKSLNESRDFTTFFDPMAGSGTFSLEAAYMAYGLIPGKCRDFALKHQPAFKEATWKHICSQFKIQNSKCTINNLKKEQHKFRILTSDSSERAVSIICHNVKYCPLAKIAPEAIQPQKKDFFSCNFKEIAADKSNHILILLNPPYGKRLNFDAPALYTKIGKFLNDALRKNGYSQVKGIHVAILAPKGECRENLLRECTLLNPAKNDAAKEIKTSHGGISLSALFC